MVFTQLGRLDRAIAENLSDIRSSFDDNAGLVLDFIVFISQRMKSDLFGYTRFTINEFCKATGRRRQELAIKHPLFIDGKKKPPEIDGFKFETVFDYTLIVMMQRNLIFRNVYEDKDQARVIRMESIRVLSDVRLNFQRKSNEVKIYDIRLSPEIVDGFIRRYYTIDTNAYKLAGKGKGRESRQSLVIYLSVLRHMLLSQGLNSTTIPLDVLANQAGINPGKETFHRKESITNILRSLKSKAGFPFEFRYVRKVSEHRFYVELTFIEAYPKNMLIREHNFYYSLLYDLKEHFGYKYGQAPNNDSNKVRQEPFQTWLIAPADINEKIGILKRTYNRIFNVELTDAEAYDIYKNGFSRKIV
jgi:hypothetical protein